MSTNTLDTPEFLELPDVASRALGGAVTLANDEFFAEKENLILPSVPQDLGEDAVGNKGGLYDGWETRRRRDHGNDWAIIRLAMPSVVRGVVIDTAFFLGNFPPQASVEGCYLPGHPTPAEVEHAEWLELVPVKDLSGGHKHPALSTSDRPVTHVRLSIYPDGGVARLRVHGEPIADLRAATAGVDLVGIQSGGRVVSSSNSFYTSPNMLLLPGSPINMADGWETARRRDGANDWAVFRLGLVGSPRLIEIDTTYFIGNAPGAARVSGCKIADDGQVDEAAWVDVLPRTDLQPDTRHRFPVDGGGTYTHLRLDIYPDGGLARFRAYGVVEATE
jgi:allantoicase